MTTGEIWNIWRDNPELASSVDFIAAHVLPYWENFTSKQAVDQAVAMFQLLRDQFPGKRIVIAEFGWPSAGYNLRNADPGPFEQASVLRNSSSPAPKPSAWTTTSSRRSISPGNSSKAASDPYWGILDASREPKFSWTGPIVNEKLLEAGCDRAPGRHPDVAADPAARAADHHAGAGAFGGANGVGAWTSTVFAYWTGHYFVFGSAFALTLGLILLVPLVLIAMARIGEIAAVAFGHGPRR